MLSLGAIGSILYLYQLAATWRALWRSCRNTRDPSVQFCLTVLVFYFACMFTEAIAFDVGLPTFCVLSVLWSRKQFTQESAVRAVSRFTPVQAY